jgi:hypothetical protein
MSHQSTFPIKLKTKTASNFLKMVIKHHKDEEQAYLFPRSL